VSVARIKADRGVSVFREICTCFSGAAKALEQKIRGRQRRSTGTDLDVSRRAIYRGGTITMKKDCFLEKLFARRREVRFVALV
jgi:hypothetical protein